MIIDNSRCIGKHDSTCYNKIDLVISFGHFAVAYSFACSFYCFAVGGTCYHLAGWAWAGHPSAAVVGQVCHPAAAAA